MPPKGGASKKTMQKVKDKIVEDKTFGLKNKNKSKKVQKFVQHVENRVNGVGSRAHKQEEKQKQEKKAAKQAKLQMKADMGELFAVDTRKEDRLKKQAEERKRAERQALKDAGLSSDSDGGGDEDDGPVFKPDWWEEGMSLEEEVEAERKALPPGGTPVTEESFREWKANKAKKVLKKKTKAMKLEEMDAAKAGKQRGLGANGKFLTKGILTGKDLFSISPTVFVDAEDGTAADNVDYKHESDDEEEGSGSASAAAAAVGAGSSSAADAELEGLDDLVASGQDYNFPSHWGEPPLLQASDSKELPGGYGAGNSTLASWVAKKLEEDAKAGTDSSKAAVAAADDADEEAVVESPGKGRGGSAASTAAAGAVNNNLFMDDLDDLDDLDDE